MTVTRIRQRGTVVFGELSWVELLVVVDETDWNNRLAKLKEKVDYYLKKIQLRIILLNIYFMMGFRKE